MFENLKRAVEELENNLTLKSNYVAELEMLDAYEVDAMVFHTLGVATWKIKRLLAEIERIREWVKQEMAGLGGEARA